MSDFSERLTSLRENKGWNKTYTAKQIGLKSMQTYANWEYGRTEPDFEMLSKLANVFGVSTDYLLNGTEKEHYYDLTDKEKKDIGVQAEKLMQGIESGHDLNFYGEPATEEQKNRLLIAVQTAMEMNKKEAKKKFTPKKYRE